MPPKGKKNEPSKKTVDKQKAKVIEDKTFGLKNKKGAKTQKFITQVEKTVKSGGNKSARQLEKEREEKFAKKDDKKKQQNELNSLFKPVDQKVSKGVDPKSVLCAFFKAGSCGKGEKCKFSHDLNIARKGEKRSLYDTEGASEQETMADWDEQKLEEVVNKKHGEKDKAKPKTSIICKHFLQAVENNKYGWFWECPSGEKCIYKHCLPPGFQLKKDKKKEDKKDEISLEELVEKERAALNSQNLTKVTLESFLKWKERKRKEKISAANKAKEKKKKNYMQGKAFGVSGREMFEFNPDLMGEEEDDEGMDLSQYKNEEDEEEYNGPVREINIDDLAESATPQPAPPQEDKPVVNGDVANSDENSKLDMAAALPPDPEAETQQAIAAAEAAIADGGGAVGGDVDIDENLFDADDLLDIENELETLDLES